MDQSSLRLLLGILETLNTLGPPAVELVRSLIDNKAPTPEQMAAVKDARNKALKALAEALTEE